MDILNISKSKLRKKILLLYFSHPEKEYYLRELERLLNAPVAYVRRELLNLEKSGLFISRFRGKQRYFRLNKNYPLYEEIKKIVFKTIGIEGSLKKLLRSIKNIQIAFIFGSFAAKKEDAHSDVDLMIIGNPDEYKLISRINKIELQMDREINYHIYSPSDLKKRVRQGDSFIKNILSKPKIFLISDENELSKLYRKRTVKKRKKM